jgi:hypothetical protein
MAGGSGSPSMYGRASWGTVAMEVALLQATRIGAGLCALIVLASGTKAVLFGLQGAGASDLLDNHYRFYAGVWVALGLGLAWCVLYLEQSTALFRFAMGAVMLGGLARVVGLSAYPPDAEMVAALVVELVLPPLLLTLHTLGLRARDAG